MSIVNKPDISRLVAWVYGGVALFILILGVVLLSYPSLQTSGAKGITATIILAVAFSLVEAVMIWILISIYGTRYVLTEHELILRATRLIGGSKRI